MARGIYKRGNTYWVRYAGLDSKIIYESSCSNRFKDAERLLIQRRQEIKEGKQPQLRTVLDHRFKDLALEYLSWARRQKSFLSKQRFISLFSQTHGNMLLKKFNTRFLEQFQTQNLEKGNKPATVNRYIATIKHMFTKADEWEMVSKDVLERVRKVKLLPEHNWRLRFLSVEECQSLIDACDSHLRPIVIVALNTGMRKGEILSLRWEQIDLKHGFILLEVTKNGERREIPINDTVREVFQSIIRRLDVPFVFYDPRVGNPYQDVKRSFPSACRRAGIKDFRFHDCRHTFGSQLVMAGIDLTTVKELLGHKTIAMTMRYAHLAPSHKVKAVCILDDTLKGKSPFTPDSMSTIQKLYNRE